MKTRQELLNFAADNWPDDKLDLLLEALQAPTEEQMKCEYCHGGREAKPIVEASSDFLAFDKSGIVAFGNDGSVTTGEDYTKIRYCPMCGRKLGDE